MIFQTRAVPFYPRMSASLLRCGPPRVSKENLRCLPSPSKLKSHSKLPPAVESHRALLSTLLSSCCPPPGTLPAPLGAHLGSAKDPRVPFCGSLLSGRSTAASPSAWLSADSSHSPVSETGAFCSAAPRPTERASSRWVPRNQGAQGCPKGDTCTTTCGGLTQLEMARGCSR